MIKIVNAAARGAFLNSIWNENLPDITSAKPCIFEPRDCEADHDEDGGCGQVHVVHTVNWKYNLGDK